MSLDALVLEAGSPALARGTVVRTAGGVAIAFDDDIDVRPDLVYPAGAAVVPLDGLADAAGLVGARVEVEGSWSGRTLTVDAPPRRLQCTSRRPAQADKDLSERTPELLPEHVGRQVDLLLDSGALVAMSWGADANGRRVLHAAALDRDAVVATLGPLLGDGLLVSESRWGAQLLEDVTDAVLSACGEGQLIAIGRTVDSGGLASVDAIVTHVSPRLAAALRDVPDGALDLRALVVPTPTS